MRRRFSLAPASTAAGGSAEVRLLFPAEPLLSLDPTALDRIAQAYHFFDNDEPASPAPASPVRVLNIDGPLVHRSSWWWCSYEDIAHELQEHLEDPSCEAIVLRIDSPGGLAAGMGETVRKLREAKVRAGKPVLAYVDEWACSAAYGLACIADQIWLPASGTVGSIGTILTLVDETKYNERLGFRVEVIASGEHKTDGHPDVPLSSGTLERMRERVMTLAGLFVAQVAEARRLAPEHIAGLKAGVFLGQRAIELGLADRLGGLEDVLQEAARLGAQVAQARASPPSSAALFSLPSGPSAPAAEAPPPGQCAPQPNEIHMKLLLAKLGLPETASEAEALLALSDQTDVQQKLLTLTGASSPHAALGAVQAWKDGSAQVAALKAQLEGVQKAREDAEKAALCDQLRSLGYSKAQVEKLAESMSLDGLRGYASVATPQAHQQEHREATSAGGAAAVAALSPEDKEMAAQLGVTEAEFAAHKAALRSGKEPR